MKNSIKRTITYTKDRAVLSDTLPYETPLTFSNRHFYKFLKDNKVELVDSIDKSKNQLVHFQGNNDKVLTSVVKTLFQLGEAQLNQEIRFDHLSAFQEAIDNILVHYGWACFTLEIRATPILRIKDKKAFGLLMNGVDNLRRDLKTFRSSAIRNHIHGVSPISVIKVCEAIIHHYCKININILKHSINCNNSHVLFPIFKDFRICKENWLNIKELRKVPFIYKISHKEADYRELSIPHPKVQIELVSFYEQYKELIIYYCGLSPFSIRKPDSIASYVFYNDKLHSRRKGDNHDYIEESGKEYESLKTFFTYRKYPNIHKFYEDYRYHRAEKKYNSMHKFDISKCFDSIYTHSVAWAVYGKNIVKDRLPESDKTFAGKFDALMQNANFGETNGILIGPEFSRIFAEIILQSIDSSIESALRLEDNLHFKKDYEIYRYVDDYFIFYNDLRTRDQILSRYKIDLKHYKMSVSDTKSKEYSKPLITELTIAKDKIVGLFDVEVKFGIKAKPDSIFSELDFRCNSKNLITKFKIIISESNVAYKDIMNFTLAILNKRVEKCVEQFDEYYGHIIRYEYKSKADQEKYPFNLDDVTKKFKHENRFTNHLLELLDFTFFIYAVDPRVNFTIKLCHILSRLIFTFSEHIKFFTGNFKDPATRTGRIYTSPKAKLLPSNKDLIFKKISDEIRLVLEKNKVKPYAQIESLYLLIALQQLGNEFRISPELLIKYFQFKRDEGGRLTFKFIPNYFVITVLLFYIRDAKPYSEIISVIKDCILKKIAKVDGAKGKNTECIMLLFDGLVCPYLDAKFKREMLTAFGISNLSEQSNLISYSKKQKYWFTKWDKFNFIDEIEAKISHEPY